MLNDIGVVRGIVESPIGQEALAEARALLRTRGGNGKEVLHKIHIPAGDVVETAGKSTVGHVAPREVRPGSRATEFGPPVDNELELPQFVPHPAKWIHTNSIQPDVGSGILGGTKVRSHPRELKIDPSPDYVASFPRVPLGPDELRDAVQAAHAFELPMTGIDIGEGLTSPIGRHPQLSPEDVRVAVEAAHAVELPVAGIDVGSRLS